MEFIEISSSAFRNFLSKCKVWEEENGVRWNRNLIGEGVAGFLDLRYSKFKKLKGITGPSTKHWKELVSVQFEEFIKWTGESIDQEQHGRIASPLDRTILAIKNSVIEVDSSTGGVPIEIAWGRISSECRGLFLEDLDRQMLNQLKGAILNSFRPKGNTTKAENFVRFLFENGPGKYRNTWEIPGGTGLMDWYIAMANEATKVQANLIALRRAEGEPDLERMSTGSGTTGSTMSTSVTDRPLTPSRQFNHQAKITCTTKKVWMTAPFLTQDIIRVWERDSKINQRGTKGLINTHRGHSLKHLIIHPGLLTLLMTTRLEMNRDQTQSRNHLHLHHHHSMRHQELVLEAFTMTQTHQYPRATKGSLKKVTTNGFSLWVRGEWEAILRLPGMQHD